LKTRSAILCGVAVLELHAATVRGKLAVLGLLKMLGWKEQK
jgi:hypothetical protein